MASKRSTFDRARKIGLTLPHVSEGTTYGSPALKLRGTVIACVAVHRSADPGSLVVRIGFEKREELLAADPETYYVRPHYVDYPVVLVREARLSENALEDLLLMAWRFATDAKVRRTRARRR